MKFNNLLPSFAALTASLFLAGTAVAAGNGKSPGDASIYDIASSTEGLEVLTTLVELAGLQDTLTNDGQFTVFAPTNDAFPGGSVAGAADFLIGACGALEPALTNTLLHHVRDGRRWSGSILAGNGPKSLEMLNGYIWVDDDLSITTGSGGESAINGGLFDVNASNGVVHAITAVMVPANVCDEPES